MAMQVIVGHLVTISIVFLVFSCKETAASMAKPGCQETCGNVTIVYPFGIGRGCSHDKNFEVSCNYSFNPPRPFLVVIEVEVLQTSVEFVRIVDWTIPLCHINYTSKPKFGFWPMEPYSYSHADNRLIGIGCGIGAYIGELNTTNPSLTKYAGGCESVCDIPGGQVWSNVTSCSGIKCCRTTFSNDLSNVDLWLSNMSIWPNDMGGSISNPCSYVIIAEKKFSGFDQFDTTLSGKNKTYYYPAVMNWAIGNKSCQEAGKSGDYACGSNSGCVDSDKGSGYRCVCSPRYGGNPYLQDGCTDIDDCVNSNYTPCKKGALCININGSYYCGCPPGYHSDDSKPEHRCVPDKDKLKVAILVSSGVPDKEKLNVSILVTSGIGIAVGLFILIAVGFWLHRQLEERKKNKLKQKFFKKNGGLLLQQQITSSSKGSVEKTKHYAIEELEKATDNFNASRVLGKGGHGAVYKGMLLDGSIVAIKKSIIVDERKVVEFVNEVLILSQINHRHIVKLLGCCLESEVPLLVYEYVSNSTLSHHLHDKNPESKLSWEKRLRIAAEIAGAIAYLHSYASPAILHRDIKSRNILLDEHFRAVVSDFGLSRSITPEKTHLSTLVQGTFGYLDPEYFRTGQFTDKSDVYGFGMILAELLTGEKAICSSRSEESLAIHFRLAMKKNCLFEILDKVIVNEDQKKEILAVARLAKICLKLSGKKRPTMKEIAADLHQLRRTVEQPSLQRTCQDDNSVSGRSYSYASTSAVTEEYVLQDQDFPKP